MTPKTGRGVTYAATDDEIQIEHLPCVNDLIARANSDRSAIIDAFAVVNLPWMRDQCALMQEHGDDPRDIAFFLWGDSVDNGSGFAVHSRKILRRADIVRRAQEIGASMERVGEMMGWEPLPGFVHVVVFVGEEGGTRSLEVYVPAPAGAA